MWRRLASNSNCNNAFGRSCGSGRFSIALAGQNLTFHSPYSSYHMSSRNFSANYSCVHVFVSVKPGTEDDFLQASLINARASSKEPGISRFDVIRQEDDATKFVLVEVYKNDDAPAAHKNTNHYAEWRKTVEHMMSEPRKAIKYKNVFPATQIGWDYGEDVPLE